MSNPLLTPLQSLRLRADACVKCGLCTPHCPSYRATQNEADSPRGRIAIADALASGAIKVDANLSAHLDGCLSCRACEKICPAHVEYGAIIDGARALIATPQRTRLARFMHFALATPTRRRLWRWALWIFSPLTLLHPFSRLLRYWPRPQCAALPVQNQQAKIAIFSSCVSDVLEREVLRDAVLLLNASGLSVAIPASAVCCGALAQHSGQAQAAQKLAQKNSETYAQFDRILVLTPGCGAALKDLLPLAQEQKVQDLTQFLAEHLVHHKLTFASDARRIGLHVACTQSNVLQAGNALGLLLSHLPEAQLVPIAPSSGCCGAAGTYFLSQPAMSDNLLAPKLDAISAQKIELIASANIGCSLHFSAGLKGKGIAVPVVHPISVLAAAFRAAN